MPPAVSTLDSMLAQAGRLYSLPEVATEVLRLTEKPEIDARAIRDCMQSDPALSARVLRVVNSSLYGLSGEIGTLDQAIALMGVTPLRLLVLGFSLPDALLEGQTLDSLRRYWTETLTRASAAREIARVGWDLVADEAFVAGMMHGIGQLVLLQQLGEDYARLLERYATSPAMSADDLASVERESIGFDHRTLSAALLRQWRLPERIAVAIERQTQPETIGLGARYPDDETACLSKSLRLTELLIQLVLRRRLGVLADLLEEGESYCGLSRKKLNTVIGSLQDRVDQLAESMAVSLEPGIDYQETLFEAHARLSLTAEDAACRLIGGDEWSDDHESQAVESLLEETQDLTRSLRERIEQPGPLPETKRAHGAGPAGGRPHLVETWQESLTQRLKPLVEDCRADRSPMSLVLIDGGPPSGRASRPIEALRRRLASTPWSSDTDQWEWLPCGDGRVAVVMSDVDRHDATRLWSNIAAYCDNESSEPISAGVAGVAQPSRSFEARTLIEAAERCLEAASEVSGPSVKGIEVY